MSQEKEKTVEKPQTLEKEKTEVKGKNHKIPHYFVCSQAHIVRTYFGFLTLKTTLLDFLGDSQFCKCLIFLQLMFDFQNCLSFTFFQFLKAFLVLHKK